MRPLNLDELEDKLRTYSNTVESSDYNHLAEKFFQFWNFLNEQPIGKIILERIDQDYKELEEKIFDYKPNQMYHHSIKIKEYLTTPDKQGAFGFFVMRKNFEKPRRWDNELNVADQWYKSRGNFNEMHSNFISFIFSPFIELVEWYIYESHSDNPKDYYSKEEINEFDQKLNEINEKLDLMAYANMHFVFEELQEVQELIQNVPRQNFGDMIKWKLFELSLAKGINNTTIKTIWETLFPTVPYPFSN